MTSDDEALTEAFWAVARQLRHGVRDTVAPFGIAPGHFRALAVLLRGGDMRLRDLADQLHIAPRSVTEVVDALEERGLVERRPDPADRRATLVVVTPEGHRVEEQLHAARAHQGSETFARLGQRDRVELARILALLTPGGATSAGRDPSS